MNAMHFAGIMPCCYYAVISSGTLMYQPEPHYFLLHLVKMTMSVWKARACQYIYRLDKFNSFIHIWYRGVWVYLHSCAILNFAPRPIVVHLYIIATHLLILVQVYYTFPGLQPYSCTFNFTENNIRFWHDGICPQFDIKYSKICYFHVSNHFGSNRHVYMQWYHCYNV